MLWSRSRYGRPCPYPGRTHFSTQPGSPLEMDEVVIRGVNTRVWKNAPPTIRDLLQLGRVHADKEFLVYENDRATFDDFLPRSGSPLPTN